MSEGNLVRDAVGRPWKHAFSILVLQALVGVGGVSGQGVNPGGVSGQGVNPSAANRVNVSVSVDVVSDVRQGLYTYSYTIQNSDSSEQEVSFVAVYFTGALPEIVNIRSPNGWTGLVHEDRPVVSWRATEGIAVPTTGFVYTGDIPSSRFQIKPGQVLNGFSFQSHDPPGRAKFFTQGFAELPGTTGDAGLLDASARPDWTQNSVSGATEGPVMRTIRPSSDGLVLVTGVGDFSVVTSPLTLVLKLGVYGEIVDRESLQVVLNEVDVTDQFRPMGTLDSVSAEFRLESSPLRLGPNTLLASVDGVVPAVTETLNDTDRMIFNVQRQLGDLNGDDSIDCSDIAIVKGSFGRRFGAMGFDPRADVNLDGLVDIRDLTFVTKRVPAGTRCP